MATRVAVLGAGLMGHGIALSFARAGWSVVVTDSDPGARASLHRRIAETLTSLGAEAVAGEISVVHSLPESVTGADLVVEAVPENLETKRVVFAAASGIATPEAILASNTSAISISQIATSAQRPDRVVGTHFWNPPYLVPLVEVVQGDQTSSETIERTMEMLRSAGKKPVHVRKDVPGFIGNRMQHALWREAIFLVESGVADAQAVDEVVRSGFGLRLAALGPLENADLVGLDLTLAIHEYLLPHLDRRPAPSPILRELVDQGHLGTKTGSGFRQWDPASAHEMQSRLTQHLMRVVGLPTSPQPLDREHGDDAAAKEAR